MVPLHLTLATLRPYLVILASTVAGIAVAFVVRRVVFPQLQRAAARTSTRADDLVLAALGKPILLWGALVGAHLGVAAVPVTDATISGIRKAILTVLVLSVSWTAGRIAADLVATGTEQARLPSANLIPNLARTAVLLIGALVLLEALGIQVTPILGALGVGGLAVGLALQDTLANLFAGIQILVSKQVRVGDFVRLSSGEEGYVTDITWRYTTIRQLANNITIVPNSKLSSAVTSNFTMPVPEQGVSVQVGVSYDSDLEHVERVTIDVAREIMRRVEGGVPAYEPSVRFHTFADSSINFSVNLRGTEYVSQYLIKHEFIKALHRRFQQEGIDIPFPIRTVYLKTSGDAASPTGS
ncbi:MAG: mechanosensitive ion channel family protein [Gemmatimonadota bacterium]|nr:mechanosensitive ion channel family protein [Gemmatimonadota bacterium]HEU4990208.1 mechanosensitive ion channel family protein [Gemmatimonadaceae bacterium]